MLVDRVSMVVVIAVPVYIFPVKVGQVLTVVAVIDLVYTALAMAGQV